MESWEKRVKSRRTYNADITSTLFYFLFGIQVSLLSTSIVTTTRLWYEKVFVSPWFACIYLLLSLTEKCKGSEILYHDIASKGKSMEYRLLLLLLLSNRLLNKTRRLLRHVRRKHFAHCGAFANYFRKHKAKADSIISHFSQGNQVIDWSRYVIENCNFQRLNKF